MLVLCAQPSQRPVASVLPGPLDRFVELARVACGDLLEPVGLVAVSRHVPVIGPRLVLLSEIRSAADSHISRENQ